MCKNQSKPHSCRNAANRNWTLAGSSFSPPVKSIHIITHLNIKLCILLYISTTILKYNKHVMSILALTVYGHFLKTEPVGPVHQGRRELGVFLKWHFEQLELRLMGGSVHNALKLVCVPLGRRLQAVGCLQDQ